MRKLLTTFLCMSVTACGMSYYVKSQAQQFSELAAQVSTKIVKIPEETKALELDVYANLIRVDRGCVSTKGEILASQLIIVDGIVANDKADSPCKAAWTTLSQCVLGKPCAICNGSDKNCIELKQLASKTRYCVHPDAAAALAKTCSSPDADGLWRRELLYGDRTDSAAQAYVEIADVAAAGSAYVSSLAALSVERKEGATKYVTDSVDRLQKALAKVEETTGKTISLGDEDKKTLEAAKGLASLLLEWKMVDQDADAIRKLVAKTGPKFEQSMAQLSISADFIQNTYYKSLLNSQTATLTAALRSPSEGTTDGEAVEIQKKINELKRKKKELESSKPISSVINSTIAAHGDLVRITEGKLTKAEREAVMQENIRQFSRLIEKIRDVIDTI